MARGDFFAEAYKVRTSERTVFKSAWCGPDKFEQWVETLVARYGKTGGDGYEVEIYCTAAPARFYKLVALPTPNSANDVRPGFVVTTGSGPEICGLLIQIAHATAQGMIGFAPPETKPIPDAEPGISKGTRRVFVILNSSRGRYWLNTGVWGPGPDHILTFDSEQNAVSVRDRIPNPNGDRLLVHAAEQPI